MINNNNIISDKKGVQQLADSFRNHGIKNIVFSPGSRNAPLIITFANDDNFKCYVIPDERSAGFFALGLAEQIQNPVALICSSGSALLNYYPAVSEAFYRNIPLVIVSADRPEEWIDQGDGQTIRQYNVFQNHIIYYTDLIENPTTKDCIWANRRKVETAIIKAKNTQKGPVHINFPFDEPLYDIVQSGDIENTQKNIEIIELAKQLPELQKEEIMSIWRNSSGKMILCGQMPKNNYLNEQLKNLTADKSVAVVVENISNLQDRAFVHCIDRTINSFTPDNESLFQPDLLITIGGAVVSKKIKNYLRKNPPKHHWKIGENFPFMDTYQCLTKSIPLNVNAFFDALINEDFITQTSRYGEQWKQLDYLAQFSHENFMTDIPFSDLSVFNFILDAVPEQSILHFANSSVVRYAQLFDPIKSIIYCSNRGTSGIEGSVSTALGYTIACGTEKVNTLIVGDMSFIYDSNAFWNNHTPANFRVFLINNGGGGIFNIIPGPKNTPNNDEFFVAKHTISARYICKTFNINYYSAKSIDEIDSQLDEFYDVLPNNRPAVMEIFTDNEFSSKVLSDYFNSTKISEIPILKK